MTAPWPARLGFGAVALRPLARRDARTWVAVRRNNEAWLRPWEASSAGVSTVDWSDRHTTASFRQFVSRQRAAARAGLQLPFAIFVGDVFAGQVTVGEIVRGAVCSGSVGYWVDERVAGRGIAPVALALVADHAFGPAGLHRLEANIRPENGASTAVVRKVGFSQEGMRRRYLAIDGVWRDHVSWALLSEDAPEGVLLRLVDTRPDLVQGLRIAGGSPARIG